MLTPARLAVVFGLLLVVLGLRAHAGSLPLGTDTRLVTSGELLATLAARERGYFNFTDYAASPLRQVRLRLAAELRYGARLALVAELRTQNLDDVELTALYARLRPWRRLDVQAGRVPPVFGGFSRRGYGAGNVVVGLPLGYQYLTTLRADARPRSADALLRWRGGGWWPAYAPGAGPGLPLAQGDLWDTGLQARLGAGGAWEGALALTQGSPSRPRVRDDNDGKAVSARVQRRWGAGLTLGLSAARGAYLARAAAGTQADRQRAFALDAEFARGPWVLRAELMRSDWDAPTVQARALRAWVGSVEMRLRLTPRLDLGARAERLAFARVTGASLSGTWDADVERCEAVLAFRAHPRAQLKAGWQQNWRDGGYVRSEGLALAQFGVRF
jgi:hypothetical protein